MKKKASSGYLSSADYKAFLSKKMEKQIE